MYRRKPRDGAPRRGPPCLPRSALHNRGSTAGQYVRRVTTSATCRPRAWVAVPTCKVEAEPFSLSPEERPSCIRDGSPLKRPYALACSSVRNSTGMSCQTYRPHLNRLPPDSVPLFLAGLYPAPQRGASVSAGLPVARSGGGEPRRRGSLCRALNAEPADPRHVRERTILRRGARRSASPCERRPELVSAINVSDQPSRTGCETSR